MFSTVFVFPRVRSPVSIQEGRGGNNSYPLLKVRDRRTPATQNRYIILYCLEREHRWTARGGSWSTTASSARTTYARCHISLPSTYMLCSIAFNEICCLTCSHLPYMKTSSIRTGTVSTAVLLRWNEKLFIYLNT